MGSQRDVIGKIDCMETFDLRLRKNKKAYTCHVEIIATILPPEYLCLETCGLHFVCNLKYLQYHKYKPCTLSFELGEK